jgi:hypothetical protein
MGEVSGFPPNPEQLPKKEKIMNKETAEKIAALRIKLANTKSVKTYRSLLAQIAGLSGDRAKKAIAGAKGGRGNKRRKPQPASK